MTRGRWRLRPDILGRRVASVAVPLLVVRVVEGVGAWLFFNEFFLATAPIPWAVHGAFVVYLLLNLAVILSYRDGRVSWRVLGVDFSANLLPLIPPVAASGGLASPLLLLFPLKASHYSIVFSNTVAGIFLLATGGMLAVVAVAERLDLLLIVTLARLAPDRIHHVVQVAALGIVIGALTAVAWLRRCLATDERAQAKRRRERAERDSTAVVAGTLLTVSEAVNRLTRLDEILETVVEIAPRSIEVDYCGIALWAEDTGTYTGAVAVGASRTIDRRFTGLQFSPDEAPDFEWVRRLGHCAVVPASERLDVAPLDTPSVLIAPLESGDRFYGVMEFVRRRTDRAFTQRDLTIADGIARQAALALERARLVEDGRRLVLAVESTEEAVLITDARRHVMFANPAFTRTFGYRRDEIIGRDAVGLVGEAGELIAELKDAWTRRSWRGECVARHNDGRAIPVMLNANLIRDDDGRVQGAVAILQDISAEKAFQEQMQRADRLAAVGETAAGIAHEVNNALAAIFGQTADGEQRDQTQLRAALAKVDGQARRIADIVQGVLEFARPRPLQLEAVDLAVVTRKTLDLMRHDLACQGTDLDTDFDADLPLARADPRQVQQVLLNLFGNALQAMAGSAQRCLRVEVLGLDGRLAARVGDRGPGIPPDVLPRVFDPFFSTKEDGSGLGLSVSYAIARAHGGDLQVASTVGRGTVFTLYLPISEPDVQDGFERILLVDDDPEVAEALAAMLAREGLRVSCATTGAEAVSMCESASWDGVFLDVRLPDRSGPDVYAELARTQPELARRVVFVTGGLWRKESRLRQQLPPQPILAKPCTQEQVRDVLRKLRRQLHVA